MKHGVLHYMPFNIPEVRAHALQLALTNITLPYIEKLWLTGFAQKQSEDVKLRQGE